MSRNLLKCQIYMTKIAIYDIKSKIYMTFIGFEVCDGFRISNIQR